MDETERKLTDAILLGTAKAFSEGYIQGYIDGAIAAAKQGAKGEKDERNGESEFVA